MTEDEAKTKWCPFVRSQVIGQDKGKLMVLSNRDAAQLVEDSDPNEFTHNCIGSACMAWRSASGDRNSIPVVYSQAEAEVVQRHRVEGHCGLAGKP